MSAKKAEPAIPKVEVVDAPERKMEEDMSAVPERGGASPDAVYAELDALREAKGYVDSPERMRPVDPNEMPKVDISSMSNKELLNMGGVIDGDYIYFGDKVFFADEEKRRTVPNQMNLAAGPRVTQMPQDGVFLPNTRSFRRVPYRVRVGDGSKENTEYSIRVDN